MTIGPDEALLGGVTPQFVVDVSAGGSTYRGLNGPSSVDELTGALRAAATYKSPVAALAIAVGVAALFAVAIHPLLALVAAVAGALVLAIAMAQARQRRHITVAYRLDVAAGLAFEGLQHGVGWLESNHALWRVTREETVQRPANTTSMMRTRAVASRNTAPYILTNVGIPSIASVETLMFFPDSLVVRDFAGNFVDVPYMALTVEVETLRFSESDAVPGDSHPFGHTWLHANKDGSPDRRRANNRQIPILEYARIELWWRHSGCVFLASNVTAARHFAEALRKMVALRNRQPIRIAPPAPKPGPSSVLPPVAPVSQPFAPALEHVAPAPPPIKPAPQPVAFAPQPPAPALQSAEPTPRRVATAPQPVARAPHPVASTPPPKPGFTELERMLQASVNRKRRELELPRRATVPLPGAIEAEWIPHGRSATVHGHATGDFVYVGRRLPQLDGSGIEPSLLNPALPIDSNQANTAGVGMNYWPSYHGISAASRTALLQWLASGRKDPNVFIGYVFIFFYGLERRVYEFMQGRGSSADEVVAIAREVARLLDLYGTKSSSFASYGESLLDLIAVLDSRARDLDRRPATPGYEVPLRLKLALGELSLAKRPIPAALALDWVRATQSLNTPAQRCAQEFELLFHIRYAKQFGDGLVIPPNKTFIQMSYRPASAALDEVTLKQRKVPDVTALTRPFEKVLALVYECNNALDAFSRFLGKNPDGREALAAFALLPEELVEATPSADARGLASLIASRLDQHGRAHLAAGELLQYVRLAKADKVSKNEATLLALALEKLGYGIEPDVRLGGPVFEVDGRAVVFRRLPDCPAVASDEYAAATLLIRLGTMVSAADDAVSEAERELLERHVEERLQLTAGERQRLAAHLAWLVDADLGMTGLKRKLEALPQATRRAIGRLLIDVAATDGRVDAREMKILEKLYAAMDLPPSDLYRDVHAAHADNEPVTVDTPAAASKGFAIPKKPAPPATSAAGLDMSRVRLKIAETREVSALLGSIFVEEGAPSATVIPVAQAGTIGTLDAAHSELLRRLAQRESWPREEIEQIAAELSLLTDGALETINDYAYATAGEPLWEDDDPVTINPSVAMELTR